MSRYTLLALVVLVAVGAGCRKKSRSSAPPPANPPGEVKVGTKYFDFTDRDGRFSVTFPWKQPTQRTRSQNTPFGPITDTLYEVQDGASSASVTVADFASPKLANVHIEQVVNTGRDAVARALNGNVVTDTRTTDGELSIRDIVIEIPGRNGQGPVYFRYIIDLRRLYTLGIMNDGFTIPPDVKDRFFKSFKILK